MCSRQVCTVPEGAATPAALLGFVRLAAYLARPRVWGAAPRTLVVDSGTGATAVGLALGAALTGAPWTVHGVMLAGQREYYDAQQRALAAAFCEAYLPGGTLCQRVMSELPGLPVVAVLGVRMRVCVVIMSSLHAGQRVCMTGKRHASGTAAELPYPLMHCKLARLFTAICVFYARHNS